jgi:hypothetical protein
LIVENDASHGAVMLDRQTILLRRVLKRHDKCPIDRLIRKIEFNDDNASTIVMLLAIDKAGNGP